MIYKHGFEMLLLHRGMGGFLGLANPKEQNQSQERIYTQALVF